MPGRERTLASFFFSVDGLYLVLLAMRAYPAQPSTKVQVQVQINGREEREEYMPLPSSLSFSFQFQFNSIHAEKKGRKKMTRRYLDLATSFF
jgi:hypothetical protein